MGKPVHILLSATRRLTGLRYILGRLKWGGVQLHFCTFLYMYIWQKSDGHVHKCTKNRKSLETD